MNGVDVPQVIGRLRLTGGMPLGLAARSGGVGGAPDLAGARHRDGTGQADRLPDGLCREGRRA